MPLSVSYTHLLYDNSKKLPHLPIVTIPTTCGTGSEITPYSILTIHKERTKRSLPHKIYPSLALIEPMYLNSAPDTITVSYTHL